MVSLTTAKESPGIVISGIEGLVSLAGSRSRLLGFMPKLYHSDQVFTSKKALWASFQPHFLVEYRSLPIRLTVGQRILDPFIGVRIPDRQQGTIRYLALPT